MSTFTCRRGKNKTRSVKAAWVFLWSSWVTLSNTCLTSLDFLILVLHVKSVDPSMNKKQEEGRIVVRTSQQFVYDTFASFLSKTLRPNIFSEKGNGTLLDSSNYWFTQIGPLPCLMHNLVSFKTKLTDGRCVSYLPSPSATELRNNSMYRSPEREEPNKVNMPPISKQQRHALDI